MKRRGLRSSSRAISTLIAVLLLPVAAQAQDYPNRPIRIVVGFSAGGSADLVARVVGSKLNAGLGQSVIIENRPGVGGNIAAELVAKAPADGYTLLVAPASFTVNPSLFRKAGFEPVSGLTSYMLFFVAHPSLPARSVKTLIALAKSRPGEINYSSAGTGTTTHIAGELLSHMAGVQMTHIAYKGTGPQLPAVIGGEVALAFGSTTVVPFIQSGKLVLLGVTGAKRFPAFPDAQTIGETLPGFEVTGWNALFAPAGTPAAIVKRVSDEVGKGLNQADVKQSFDAQGLDQAASTPEALAALVRSETAKWAKVIKAAGIPQQ